MPLKLNTGISRKVGQPNYGSVQASCFLEVELTSDVLQDYEKFRAQVRNAFGACEQAVEEQLATEPSPAASSSNGHSQNGQSSNGSGNGHVGNVRQATQSQVRAIKAIAGKQRIDVTSFLLNRHGCNSAETLTLKQASEVIDELKSQSGNGVAR